MRRYVFADQKVFAVKNASKADPQKIGEALDKIAARNNGEIEPSLLWKEAQNNARHPCHHLFEWDVKKAAEQAWTDTARRIIRAIVPLDEDDIQSEIPAFISVNTGGGTSYRSSQEVMDSKEMRDVVLAAALRDLESYQLRYRRFREIFEALEKPIQVVRRLRGRPKGKGKEDRPSV